MNRLILFLKGLDARQVLGLTGALLVFAGLFLPAAKAPLAGRLSVMSISAKYGTMMACAAAVAVVFCGGKAFRGLWFTGGVAALMLPLVHHAGKIRLLGRASSDGPAWANNFVKSMQHAAMKSVHYQWGLAVIVAGIALMLLAAASGRERKGGGSSC
jgi:hypothetical protein